MTNELVNIEQKLVQLEKLLEDKQMSIEMLTHDIKNEIASLGVTLRLMRKAANSGVEHFYTLIDHAEESRRSIIKIIDNLSTKQSGFKL